MLWVGNDFIKCKKLLSFSIDWLIDKLFLKWKQNEIKMSRKAINKERLKWFASSIRFCN